MGYTWIGNIFRSKKEAFDWIDKDCDLVEVKIIRKVKRQKKSERSLK